MAINSKHNTRKGNSATVSCTNIECSTFKTNYPTDFVCKCITVEFCLLSLNYSSACHIELNFDWTHLQIGFIKIQLYISCNLHCMTLQFSQTDCNYIFWDKGQISVYFNLALMHRHVVFGLLISHTVIRHYQHDVSGLFCVSSAWPSAGSPWDTTDKFGHYSLIKAQFN